MTTNQVKIEDNIIEIECDLYHIDVVVAVGKDTLPRLKKLYKHYEDELYKHYGEEYSEMESAGTAPAATWDAMKDSIGNKKILVWYKDIETAKEASYVAHESTHAALFIFKHIGADVDVDNQEPFVYLVDYIVGETTSIITELDETQNKELFR